MKASSRLPAVALWTTLSFLVAIVHSLAVIPEALPAHHPAAIIGKEIKPRDDKSPSVTKTPDAGSQLAPNQIVWRGEVDRGPKDIKAMGGMYAHGVLRLLRGEVALPSQLQRSCSLYWHVYGKGRRYTKYVSTSTRPENALSFAGDFEGASRPAYLYKIRVDAKMIDVGATLDGYDMEEDEQAVVGMIPWDQIVGWYDAESFLAHHSAVYNAAVRELSDEGRDVPGFTPNPDFRPEKYEAGESNGAQPQLAGFTPNHPAWEKPPWKVYRHQKLSDNMDMFVEEKITHTSITRTGGHADTWEWARTPQLQSTIPSRAEVLKAQLKEERERALYICQSFDVADDASKQVISSGWENPEVFLQEMITDMTYLRDEMIRTLDADQSLDPGYFSFKDMMEVVARLRRTLATTHKAFIVKEAEQITQVLQEWQVSNGQQELESDADTLDQVVDELSNLVHQERARLDDILIRKGRVAAIVKQKPQDRDQKVLDTMKDLDISHLAAPRETIIDAAARELEILQEEATICHDSHQVLESKLQKAEDALARVRARLGELEQEGQRPAKGEREALKEAHEVWLEKVKNNRERAIDNIIEASEEPGMSPWIKDAILGAGLVIGSIGLGSIAAGMAIGQGAPAAGGAAAAAVAESAGLLESFEVTQHLMDEMRVMTSAKSINAVSHTEAMQALSEIDPRLVQDVMTKTRPKVSKKIMEKAVEKVAEHSLDRRSLFSIGGGDDDDDAKDLVKRWSAVVMKEPLDWALKSAFRQVVTELIAEV